ncbi:MAG: SDR family oxidoreductase [bacterium]|nr:SDR family oxidoreductase [bacterium]
MTGRGEGTGKTALITGASAGIGRSLAREFAAHGFNLVLVARSADKLEQLAKEVGQQYGVEVLPKPMDLLDPSAPQRLFDELAEQRIPIEVLVNDAGTLESGAFRETGLDRLLAMLQLNIAALTLLTRLFVEPMVQGGGGRILNVSSLGAFFPSPSMAVYGATKAFILSLSESLSEELQETGVTVTALCPGFTTTHLLDDIDWLDDLAAFTPAGMIMDPDEVARDGYQACMNGDSVRIPGVPNRLAVRVLGWQPRALVRSFLGVVARKWGQ